MASFVKKKKKSLSKAFIWARKTTYYRNKGTFPLK